MLYTETGALPGSDYYFAQPSQLAKSLFYYLLCVGSYECEAGYSVKRESYNSLLLMLVQEGECRVKTNTFEGIARAGDIVILNCYRPHEYGTDNRVKLLWMHFDGAQSLDFVELLQRGGIIFPCPNPALFEELLTGLLRLFRTKQTISEPSVSCLINSLLCNLISPISASGALELSSDVSQKAMNYVGENYSMPLTTEMLARQVSMSVSYFSRMFKKETGYAPYEYILKVRLDKAKKLLKQTEFSIARIAEETGFNSLSNFVYSFHQKVGLSPTQFRNLPF